MKKTFSIFMFCISLLLFPSALVRADGGSLIPSDNEITVTPSISQTDIDNANSIGYLFEILRQGGSIDCTNAEDDYGLDDLVDDFYTNIWNEWRDLTGTTDTVYWLNPFSDDLIHSQEVVYMKPNDQLYKTVKPLRNWLNQPQNQITPSVPTPQPNPDYTSYITQINETSFFWKNWANPNSTYPTYYSLSPMSAMSYFRKSPLNEFNALGFSNGIACSVQSIYIYSIPDTDNYSFTFTVPIQNVFDGVSNEFTANTSRQMLIRGNPVTTSPIYTYTGTLEYCLRFLRTNVINVNIYVDGVPWAIVNQPIDYHVSIGGGTYVETTNQPVEYTYDIDIYIPLDDIIDRLDTLIRQKQVITYPDISDLIVDVNGQPAVAVIDVSHENIDDYYVKNYGTLIPIFPLSVSYPVSNSEMVSIIEPAVSVIPDDIIGVLGVLFIGGLFVCLLQRLLE